MLQQQNFGYLKIVFPLFILNNKTFLKITKIFFFLPNTGNEHNPSERLG